MNQRESEVQALAEKLGYGNHTFCGISHVNEHAVLKYQGELLAIGNGNTTAEHSLCSGGIGSDLDTKISLKKLCDFGFSEQTLQKGYYEGHFHSPGLHVFERHLHPEHGIVLVKKSFPSDGYDDARTKRSNGMMGWQVIEIKEQ